MAVDPATGVRSGNPAAVPDISPASASHQTHLPVRDKVEELLRALRVVLQDLVEVLLRLRPHEVLGLLLGHEKLDLLSALDHPRRGDELAGNSASRELEAQVAGSINERKDRHWRVVTRPLAEPLDTGVASRAVGVTLSQSAEELRKQVARRLELFRVLQERLGRKRGGDLLRF